MFENYIKMGTICTTEYCNDPKCFGIDAISHGTEGEINVRMSLHMKTGKEPGEDQTIHGSWTVGNSISDQMAGLPVGIRKGDCEDTAAIIASHIDILQLLDMHNLIENMETVFANMPEDYQQAKSSMIELGKCMWRIYEPNSDTNIVPSIPRFQTQAKQPQLAYTSCVLDRFKLC